MGLLPCTRMLIKKNLENLQRWERKIRDFCDVGGNFW